LLLIANCLVAPVSEDFAMRGFLFRGWSKSFLGPIGAILPTSAVWTLLHTQYSWVFLAQTFLVGLIFGYWCYRAGSTWLTVIMHGAWNTAVMAQIALMVTDT
jgi:membrane protease YdiL (CAAX protease family)